MNVEILYFAILRERVGRDRESLDLPAGADVRAARRDWLPASGVGARRARPPAPSSRERRGRKGTES